MHYVIHLGVETIVCGGGDVREGGIEPSEYYGGRQDSPHSFCSLSQGPFSSVPRPLGSGPGQYTFTAVVTVVGEPSDSTGKSAHYKTNAKGSFNATNGKLTYTSDDQ
jgi:hypothetical protein